MRERRCDGKIEKGRRGRERERGAREVEGRGIELGGDGERGSGGEMERGRGRKRGTTEREGSMGEKEGRGRERWGERVRGGAGERYIVYDSCIAFMIYSPTVMEGGQTTQPTFLTLRSMMLQITAVIPKKIGLVHGATLQTMTNDGNCATFEYVQVFAYVYV